MRASTAFEALAAELRAPWYGWWAGMLRAVRATMEGRFADAERLAAEARDAGRAAGHEAADRIWITNRESQLRAADRHEDMLAWEPEARRSRAVVHVAAAWQSTGSALMHARLERAADARMHVDAPARGVSHAGWQPVRDLLRQRGGRHRRAARAGAGVLRGHQACARRLRDAGLELPLAGRGRRRACSALLAASLERWDEAFAHFEEAIALCRRLGARPYLARTEYEYGRALIARGDRARASELIASARRTASELGMPGLVRLADAKLAEIGGAPRRAGDAAETKPRRVRRRRAGAAAPFSFAREGEYWAVTHAGATFRLKDSLGIQYLVRLIEAPGREIHVLDLTGERAAGGAGVNEAIDTGDAGELLDDEARRSYQRRLEDLEETVAEAESFGDAARAARAREEIEMLGAELGRAVGLGGRARRAGGAAERARSAVQRRIKNAIERIGEHDKTLAALLGRTVRTGNYCVYRPDPSPDPSPRDAGRGRPDARWNRAFRPMSRLLVRGDGPC